MKKFREIVPSELSINPFITIGKEWMLITAMNDGKINTMTASWGGLGVLWNKNVAYIFVRKSRYTKEFIDASETFSLTVYDREKYGKMLSYTGAVSGRDANKVEKMGLTTRVIDETPFFDEAKLVLTCKKMSSTLIDPKDFVDTGIKNSFYSDKDYHVMYVGEITHIMCE